MDGLLFNLALGEKNEKHHQLELYPGLVLWRMYICLTEILIQFVTMDDKVVCRISICTARSPGIEGFHVHIKEGVDYIDIPIQHMALWLCVERGDALASCLA